MSDYTILVPDETRARLASYLGGLRAAPGQAGARLSREGYFRLYERRLLPVFRYVNHQAGRERSALLTIPGLGCGQFAGPFRGRLGAELRDALEKFLEKHGAAFPNLKAVYFDPF